MGSALRCREGEGGDSLQFMGREGGNTRGKEDIGAAHPGEQHSPRTASPYSGFDFLPGCACGKTVVDRCAGSSARWGFTGVSIS